MKKGENSRDDSDEEMDVTNLQLRNYFQNRIEEKEPTLILKQKQGNYDSYSRLCQSSESRQPVIVTQKEMEKIRREYPEYNEKENYIEYGTDSNNKYTYICPKYWNMRTNKPVSEGEMNSKKLQKHIIPRNAKTVPANTYIYEFTNEKGLHYGFPNFISDRHPDGYCLPCCFKHSGKKKLDEVRKKCSQESQETTKNIPEKTSVPEKEKKTRKKRETMSIKGTKTKKLSIKEAESEDEEGEEDEEPEEFHKESPEEKMDEEEKEEEEKRERQETSVEYIKGPDKFPLEPGRWGYLPVGLQKLLEHDNTKCQISSTNALLKPDHPCLLRHGITYNLNQSFLQCIADVRQLTIDQLKQDIYDLLDFDMFLMMNNGNMVIDFYNDPKHVVSQERMKICRSSNYARRINKNDKDHFETFERSCISYDIFMDYFMSPNSVIDHTYMWDIVSVAFKASLCIFEIPDDDITDNVEILCPTNHYTKNLIASSYDDIIMIVKKHELYEPIYLYTRRERGPPKIERDFSKKDKTVNSVIKVLKDIQKFMKKKCHPENVYDREKQNNVYIMKTPIHIKTALDVLTKSHNYSVIAQVINYNNKVIGLFVEAVIKDKRGKENEVITCVVPVQPSGILDVIKRKDNRLKKDKNNKYEEEKQRRLYSQIYMATDPDILSSYEDTIKFYNNLCKNTKGIIPCKLVFKVVEDEMVVGFITQTNQFVMIDPPVPLYETDGDDIPVLYEVIPPYPNVDKAIMKEQSGKNEFSLKRERYVDNLKQDSEQYIIFRNTIKMLLKKNGQMKDILKEMITENKYTNIENIIGILKDISSEKIIFVDQDKLPVPLEELNVRDENPIVLIGNGNEEKYYYKIADGLIRNTRLREYILSYKPIVVEKDDYDVNTNEVILNESMILEYYDNLTAVKPKPNKYTSYDETQPFNQKEFEERDHYNFYEDTKEDKKDCITDTTTSVFSGLLSKYFDKETNVLERFNCSYGLIQSIIPTRTTVDQLRISLIQEYKKYERYMPTIIRILRKQGKKRLMDEMLTKNLPIEEIILSTNYYLTTLDIGLLCVRYKVPCILLSNRRDVRSHLIESRYHEKSFLLYGTPQNNFSFIIVPGIKLKDKSLRLMKKENQMFYESYVYSEEELKNPEPIQVALNYSYPIEEMLKYEEERFNQRKKEGNESEKDEDSDEEDSEDEFEFE
jgi:hypothetical protein